MEIYFSWRMTYKEEGEGKGEQRKLSISDYGGYDMGNTILGAGATTPMVQQLPHKSEGLSLISRTMVED